MSNPLPRKLEEVPSRVLMFLRAAATATPIRDILARNGYTQAEHDYAWGLLLKVAGYDARIAPNDSGTPAARAMAELDALDEGLLRKSRAVLTRFHPDHAAFVFEHLEPSTGAGAVVSVGLFLDRLDQLENAAARSATRDGDQAALSSLSARGITAAERARLRELVTLARRVTSAPVEPEANETELAQNMMALKSWYMDWSETARAIISRRDHLIRLGVSKRKRASNKDEDDATSVDQTLPGPVPAPAAPAPAVSSSSIAQPPISSPIN